MTDDEYTIRTVINGHDVTARIVGGSPEREAELTVKHLRGVVARGATESRLWFRAGWWGRAGVVKEVGPPPWPWPRIVGNARWRRPHPAWTVGIGWRFTLWTVTYVAKRRTHP